MNGDASSSDEQLRRADFELYIQETFRDSIPTLFPLVRRIGSYGFPGYESPMVDELFRTWIAHLDFMKWERKHGFIP
jgi:hypothetical protein